MSLSWSPNISLMFVLHRDGTKLWRHPCDFVWEKVLENEISGKQPSISTQHK